MSHNINSSPDELFTNLENEISRLKEEAKRVKKVGKSLSMANLNAEEVYLELEKKKREVEYQKKELELANLQIKEAMNALWGEMELAKKIQTVLLPKHPKIPGYDLAVYIEPTDLVGGDYYDIINSEKNHWLIIGDVSGHGISSGLVMMMAHTAIQTALTGHAHLSPLQLLTIVNKSLTSSINKLGVSKYITITVLCCQEDGNFIFSGLHQDILIYRNKSKNVEVVETNGMWLGLEDDIMNMLQIDSLKMESEDVLLLFTDGLTESFDKQDNLFGNDRLMEILKNNGRQEPKEIINAILEAAKKFRKDDDMTLIVLKRSK